MSKTAVIGKLMGKSVKVVDASNKDNLKVSGTVIDESKNTITIKTPKGNKRLLRKQIKLSEI